MLVVGRLAAEVHTVGYPSQLVQPVNDRTAKPRLIHVDNVRFVVVEYSRQHADEFHTVAISHQVFCISSLTSHRNHGETVQRTHHHHHVPHPHRKSAGHHQCTVDGGAAPQIPRHLESTACQMHVGTHHAPAPGRSQSLRPSPAPIL